MSTPLLKKFPADFSFFLVWLIWAKIGRIPIKPELNLGELKIGSPSRCLFENGGHRREKHLAQSGVQLIGRNVIREPSMIGYRDIAAFFGSHYYNTITIFRNP